MEKENKFLKSKLGKLLFEEEKDKGNQTQQGEKSPKTETPVSSIDLKSIVSSARSIKTSEGEVNEEYFNNLLEAIKREDIPGNDYLEFRKAIVGMGTLGFTEVQLYAAAFVSLNSQDGMTRIHLLESITHYQKAIEEEKKSFAQDLVNVKKSNTGAIESELAQSQEEVQNLRKQLLEIQKAIDEKTLTIETKKSELSEISQRIEKAEKDFALTVEVLENQISGDREKILQYVPDNSSSNEDKKGKKKN